MNDYYAARAAEYERIYERPERQDDLARLRQWLVEALAGRRVLEVACGTGYWTAIVAPAAESIVATDLTPEVLAIARAKALPPDRVEFRVADAFALAAVPGAFDAALVGFWWSHVPREALPGFLSGLHARVGTGATIVAFDNRYVDGSSTPIWRTDAAGNTYQRRRLVDGTEHEVMKNFPSAVHLAEAVTDAGGDAVDIRSLTYFWLLQYRVGRRT